MRLAVRGPQGRPFQPVDLAKVAGDGVSDLEVRILEVNGQVEIGALRSIPAVPAQMERS